MPIRRIPGTDLSYYLLCFDRDGAERLERDARLLSEALARALEEKEVTDVFLMSHGWLGDVPAAVAQYDAWISEMVRSAGDLAAAGRRPRGFRPLIVGLHWPSLPWGDEDLPAPGTPGLLGADDARILEDNVQRFAQRIADTPEARDALRTIFEAAVQPGVSDALQPEVVRAYQALFRASGLSADEIDGAPGNDFDGWDAQKIVDDADLGSEGLLSLRDDIRNVILMPLRVLSFWKMKDRARRFGEAGGRALLSSVMARAPRAQVHLMGHSFGCIAVSAAIAGHARARPLPRPCDSLFLVQGALSLWSYCGDIPVEPGRTGYFHRIVASQLVRGPIVTTRSEHDSAVGRFYPLGARLRRQLILGDGLPRYGGVGTFGAQGLTEITKDIDIQSSTHDYRFVSGLVYNLDASTVIAAARSLEGAHSDIVHPEVAHAMWSAVLAASPPPP